MLDLALALLVPLVTIVGTLLVAVALDEQSLAPAPGTPERRRTSARLWTWGTSMMIGAAIVLVLEVITYGYSPSLPVLSYMVGTGGLLAVVGKMDGP